MSLQKIKFTDGCPNGCHYCYESKVEFKTYPMPEITENKVQILDMNFLANPDHLGILDKLPKAQYELVCGVDYRRMTQTIAYLLKAKNFIKIRWAWDYWFNLQKTQKRVFEMFLKADYDPNDLSIFVLANWKIPFLECVKKLDLMKVWGVKVNDCCFDGGYKRAKAYYWTGDEIKTFRKICRKHNQLVNFRIDPEWESEKQEVFNFNGQSSP